MGWASCFKVRILSLGVPGSSGSCLVLFGRSGFSRFPSSTLLPLFSSFLGAPCANQKSRHKGTFF